VDAADDLNDPEAWCDGVRAAVARMPGRAPAEAVAFHVAAVRELFEEAGVLLARDRDGAIVALAGDAARRFHAYRADLAAGAIDVRDVAQREGLRLALDALALFAHWVTPVVETRRFDTHFFFAIAPEAQQAAHDDRETTHGRWIAPAEAIARCRGGEIALPPPTWTTLRALARFSTVDEAWAWAQAQTVPRVQPAIVERDDGTRLVMLPGDPRCPAVEGFEAQETRFLLEDGRWRPVEPD
jgi:8-oxo-dGTP pyrophosphatase MutT (NUDIX family)